MSIHNDPWEGQLAAAQNTADLNKVWEDFGAAASLDSTVHNRLVDGLTTRQAELNAGVNTAPSPTQVVTSLEKLAQIEEDSFQTQQDYRDALDRYAKGHTAFKTIRAKKYLYFRSQKVENAQGKLTAMSNAEADMQADADDDVAAARLEAYIAEGLVKSTRSNMDRLERSFQYHRSLMVNERGLDNRPGAQ